MLIRMPKELEEESSKELEDSCWKTNSVRKISGNRFEIFLADVGNHSYEYARILMAKVMHRLKLSEHDGFPIFSFQDDPQNLIDLLVKDATEKARQSLKRLDDAEFENFSILVTFERCEAQPMHIDGMVTQGVYFITDDSPATKTWHPKEESSITTPRALTDYAIKRKLVPGIDLCVWEEIRHSERMYSTLRGPASHAGGSFRGITGFCSPRCRPNGATTRLACWLLLGRKL